MEREIDYLKMILLLCILDGALLLCSCNSNKNLDNNQEVMKMICKTTMGGEGYIWEIGLSEQCGFQIFEGVCVEDGYYKDGILYGKLIPNSEYVLVNGSYTKFDAIPEFPYDDINKCNSDAFRNIQECEEKELKFELERCKFLEETGG